MNQLLVNFTAAKHWNSAQISQCKWFYHCYIKGIIRKDGKKAADSWLQMLPVLINLFFSYTNTVYRKQDLLFKLLVLMHIKNLL